MQRPFDQQRWKTRIAEWWQAAAQDLPGTMQKLGVRTAYGTLTASAWLPLLTAYGNDPGPAVAALVTILSGVGTNLLSNLVQGAYDDATAPQSAEQEVAEQTELRAEYQQMLAGLDVLTAAQGALGEQWAAFETRLQEELARMGGGLCIETGGGAVVFGNVVVPHGDFVGRDKVVIQIGTPSPDTTPLREAYLRHLESRCGRLPLRGVDVQAGDPTAQREHSRLARVYIHLDTTAAVAGEEKGKRRTGLPLEAEAIQGLERGAVSEVRRLSALETAVSNRCLVLLGAPGSGKSTFVRHLALCLAKAQLEPQAGWMEHLPGWPADQTGALPVVVVLRDFARWATGKKLERGTAQALGDFIAARLQEHDLADFVQPLREALHRGETIVLLDGLDEVPTKEQRGLVRDAVDSFARTYGKSRLLVTCRTLSYQDRAWQLIAKQFPTFELAPFDEEKIDRFIGAWYAELADLGAVQSEDVNPLADKLRRAVRRPDLWRLAPNPLLLTVMALVHAHKGRLPEARALLYEECTDLLLWRWEQVKLQAERDRLPGLRQLLAEAKLQDIDLKQVLWALAFEAHGATGGDDDKEATAGIPEADLLRALRKLHPQQSWGWAAKVVGEIKERAGLLIEREPEVYAFPHRTFQEYLAGCHLSVQADFAPQAASLLGEAAFWRQVVLLAVGRQVHVPGELARPLALVTELCPADEPADERGWRRVWLAGEVLLEAGVERAARSALGRDLLARVRDRLVPLLETGHLAPRERAEAGDVLGKLGDPRPGVGVVVGATGRSPLPDIVWCEVPAGSFLMGSTKDNKRAYDDERPQHTLTLPGFHISRYPITNAQYGAFVEAGGYDKPLYWTENGWGWRTGEREVDLSVIDDDSLRKNYAAWLAGRPLRKRDRPFWWDDPSWNLSSRPVVGVSWYEALAFCAWLQEQIRRSQEQSVWRDGKIKICRFTDSTVRLPSEAEWEKAARGVKGNEWPWGRTWAEGRANTSEMAMGATSAVGCFPAGASPCGALGMAGNVWEWTRSRWGKRFFNPDCAYPYEPTDGREELGEPDLRVVRGGSWNNLEGSARCACRTRVIPDDFDDFLGFRVVVSLAVS